MIAPPTAPPKASYRIGEAAMKAGVSTRTLRYYQELGLLHPGAQPGAARRYSHADVARLERIIELRSVMGFDLERIGVILSAEDRLAELKQEAQRGITTERRKEIVAEAIAINTRLREEVSAKRAVLDGFLAELEAKAERYAGVAAELGMTP